MYIQSNGCLFNQNQIQDLCYTIMNIGVNWRSHCLVLYIGLWWYCSDFSAHNSTMDCNDTQLSKNPRANPDSKIIAISNCKSSKKWLLDVDSVILIRYYYQTAKPRALYKSTDGPAGQLTDAPSNSAQLRDVHYIIHYMMIRSNWQTGSPGWN